MFEEKGETESQTGGKKTQHFLWISLSRELWIFGPQQEFFFYYPFVFIEACMIYFEYQVSVSLTAYKSAQETALNTVCFYHLKSQSLNDVMYIWQW